MINKIRKYSDWLIHKIGNKFLIKYSNFYKGTLVDLGCGEAPYKSYLLNHIDKYVGVDWSNTLHNTKADITSDLNTKIQLPDNYADTIISFSVMEHLCEPQVFLQESYRILKKAGFSVVEIVPQAGFFTMIAPKINYFTIRMFKFPKWIWTLWLISLIPFWTFNQIMAMLLDRFDNNFELETTGFSILVTKV